MLSKMFWDWDSCCLCSQSGISGLGTHFCACWYQHFRVTFCLGEVSVSDRITLPWNCMWSCALTTVCLPDRWTRDYPADLSLGGWVHQLYEYASFHTPRNTHNLLWRGNRDERHFRYRFQWKLWCCKYETFSAVGHGYTARQFTTSTSLLNVMVTLTK